jgi:hypothetical protein
MAENFQVLEKFSILCRICSHRKRDIKIPVPAAQSVNKLLLAFAL